MCGLKVDLTAIWTAFLFFSSLHTHIKYIAHDSCPTITSTLNFARRSVCRLPNLPKKRRIEGDGSDHDQRGTNTRRHKTRTLPKLPRQSLPLQPQSGALVDHRKAATNMQMRQSEGGGLRRQPPGRTRSRAEQVAARSLTVASLQSLDPPTSSWVTSPMD